MSSDKTAKPVSYLWPPQIAGITEQEQPLLEAHGDICADKTF